MKASALRAAITGDGGLLQVRKRSRRKFLEPGIDIEDLAEALGTTRKEIIRACATRKIPVRWMWRPISDEDAEAVIGAFYRKVDLKGRRTKP